MRASGGGGAGIGTISAPAPTTASGSTAVTRGVSGSGGGEAVGVLRRGTTSGTSASIEMSGMDVIGEAGTLAGVRGIGVMGFCTTGSGNMNERVA